MKSEIFPAVLRPLAMVLAAGTLSLPLAPLSLAQSLEEVIVTAQKRAESAQDVPISITAISGEQLAISGAANLESLSDSIPNVDISDSPGVNRVVIRGLGSGTGNVGFEQSVGLFVDGIYASRAALFQAPFLDLERVEVLKGPQGVLFGKNSVAGALSLISNRPTDILEGHISARHELEHGSQRLTGVVSGPLTERISGRLAAQWSEQDAYMRSAALNTEVPTADTSVMRGMLRWDATDTTEVMLKLETSKLEERGTNWQVVADYSPGTLPSSLETNPGFQPGTPIGQISAGIYRQTRAAGEDFRLDNRSHINLNEYLDQDSDTATVEIKQQLGDYELTYIGGYGEYRRDQYADFDFTAVNLADRLREEDFEQLSHELRIASPQGQTLSFIAGLYYLDRKLEVATLQNLFGAVPLLSVTSDSVYREDSTTWSAFGQVTWEIRPSLRLNAGLRYSRDDKDAASEYLTLAYQGDARLADVDPGRYALIGALLNYRDFAYSDDRSEENVDPAASLQWDFSDQGMFYLSWVKASKAGGFNASESAGDITQFGFEPETAYSVELGVKTDWLDGRARVNAAVFRTDFDDLQVGAFDPSVNNFVISNAAKAVSQGVELEGLVAASETVTLGANVAYLQAEYRDFSAGCPNNPVQAAGLACYPNPRPGAANLIQDLDGVQVDNAPEWTGSMFADYSAPVGARLIFNARLDASFKGETSLDFSQDENLFEDEYWKLNLRLGLASAEDTWEAALSLFNITDEQPTTFAGQAFLQPGVYWKNRGRGREVELSVTYRFGG